MALLVSKLCKFWMCKVGSQKLFVRSFWFWHDYRPIPGACARLFGILFNLRIISCINVIASIDPQSCKASILQIAIENEPENHNVLTSEKLVSD